MLNVALKTKYSIVLHDKLQYIQKMYCTALQTKYSIVLHDKLQYILNNVLYSTANQFFKALPMERIKTRKYDYMRELTLVVGLSKQYKLIKVGWRINGLGRIYH